MKLATIVLEEPLLTVLRARHSFCLGQSAESALLLDITLIALRTTTHVLVHKEIY